ncbi:FUSC family protein [Sphingomonas hankookensis]
MAGGPKPEGNLPGTASTERSRLLLRRLDIGEHVLSVLLAIVIAHAIGAANVNWAAFTGYMVLRGHFADTLVRGMLRITGTLAGGVAALLIVPRVEGSWAWQALILLLIGTATQYGAIVGRRAYAWLFVGLTFAMVQFDAVEQPGLAVPDFVRTRLLETVAGTLACVAVGLMGTLTLRRLWPAEREPGSGGARWHPGAARHAAQSGMALAILAVLSAFVALPGLAQAPVTIMAVMLVPASAIGPSGLAPVSSRMGQRIAGCLAGAALAGTVLLVAHGSAVLLIAGTVAGVAIGRMIETGEHARRYVGTQFVLAVLVILVPDTYADAQMEPGWHRLLGILTGIAVLGPVLVAWHWIGPLVGGRQGPVRDGGHER